PFLVVQEHEIAVAAVVEFFAAVLAKCQDRTAGRVSGGGMGLAEAVADLAEGSGQCDFQGGVGDAGDVARDLFERPIADDVVRADAKRLALANAAESAQ